MIAAGALSPESSASAVKSAMVFRLTSTASPIAVPSLSSSLLIERCTRV